MEQNFSLAFEAFGRALGLDVLSLDEDGYCCLSFDTVSVHVELLGAQQHVLLHTCLGQMPAPGAAALSAELLHANHFFSKTAGATIGVHPSSGSIDMALILEARHITEQGLQSAFENFVNVAESWQRRLSVVRADVEDERVPMSPVQAEVSRSAGVADWLSHRV